MPQSLVIVLLVLACPLGMCLMMLMGWRERKSRQPDQPRDTAGPPASPDRRAEVIRLRAEFDQLKAALRDRSRKPAGTGDQPPQAP